VFYPLGLLPRAFDNVYALNPIVVVVQVSRWAFVGGQPPPAGMVAVSCAVATVLLLSGLWFFRRHEGRFADLV
jgi:lipopolysaccharide transport system permease protein